MNKAYKFRLYPNEEQIILFAKTFGCVRFIYNKMLADKINYYQEIKQKLNNTPAQYKEEFPFLKEVDSLALANSQLHLQNAYNNFFKSPKVGFPKFKSKKDNHRSYTTNSQKGSILLVNNCIKLPKVGYVKVKQHRIIPANQTIKSATISQTPAGKYYVSILVEYEYEMPNKTLDRNKALGLDYSSHSFYVDNQGNEANYPKFYRNTQKVLSKEQRKMSLMKYGSNNYHKQKTRVANIQEHISNQRKDWLHKLSHKLANEYDYICIEDINMRGMAQTLTLGKATNDNGFGMFRDFLKYKMQEKGKQLIKIDRWFPSSKTCHICGCVNKNLKLSDRVWACECGETLNRDENAAINILREGLKLLINN